MAQLNLLVGDIKSNTENIIEAAKEARFHYGAHVIVFPELSLTGYPPEDLLLRSDLTERIQVALDEILERTSGIDIIIGYPKREGAILYNAASVLRDGKIVKTYYKQSLPNYSVFDEKRYFTPGNQACVVEINGVPVGLTICEDVWEPEPIKQAVDDAAQLIINLNASPFDINKYEQRNLTLQARVKEVSVPILYVNLVGGQDELVFDGASFIMAADGSTCYQAPAFEAGLYLAEFEIAENNIVPLSTRTHKKSNKLELAYKALVLGVKDYIEKNSFPGALIGLSGGIDSALTLAIVADAIGADKVEAVMMPSRYTSELSLNDARKEAEDIGVEYHVLSIEPLFTVTLETLKNEFMGTEVDVTEENIQARCRGVLLMAISNKKHKMVITTGNKSELAVGYATLYGDMAGGFNALKDVPKTLVYKLAEYRNTISLVIPQSVIHRAPSAELAPNQKDADSLPDYGELDGILELYVEQDMSINEIVAAGYNNGTVRQVVNMVDRNEYKRRQAAPGVRISLRAFGRDRRYPITSGYNKAK